MHLASKPARCQKQYNLLTTLYRQTTTASFFFSLFLGWGRGRQGPSTHCSTSMVESHITCFHGIPFSKDVNHLHKFIAKEVLEGSKRHSALARHRVAPRPCKMNFTAQHIVPTSHPRSFLLSTAKQSSYMYPILRFQL